MNIEIKNIRKVHYADIMLNGLTVLTGHNDIGKTTVAKSVFLLWDINYIDRELLFEIFDEKIRESFKGSIENSKKPHNTTSIISAINGDSRLSFCFENDVCKLSEFTEIYQRSSVVYIDSNQLRGNNVKNYACGLLWATESKYRDLPEDIMGFTETIAKIIDGTMLFKPMMQSFVIENGNEYITDIQLSKQAFGILQTFCMTYMANNLPMSKSKHTSPILILDEPETGLHPELQLLYAKLIIKLVKLGATVLITSNSPYLVEALSTYSKREDLESKTSFYVGGSSDLGTVFQYEEQNLNRTFEKFAIPMRRLL